MNVEVRAAKTPHPTMLTRVDRDAVSAALTRIADLLALKGENPFKVRAFENAARIVAGIPDLPAVVREGKLETVKGIGKSIASEITALVASGSSPALASLEKEIPASLPELLRIPGLGTKKAATLWKDLGVTSLGELEYAIRENRLVSLPGFGEKSQKNIDEGLRFVRSTEGRARLPEAWAQADAVRQFFLSAPAEPAGVEKVEIAGELRRGCETVSSVTLVVACRRPETLPAFPREKAALPVIVDAGPRESFGNRLLRSTGSDAHLRDLEARDSSGALRSPASE